MSKNVVPVTIEVMSGDRCVQIVRSKYWKRDYEGNPIRNMRYIEFGPFPSVTTHITHLVVDGKRVEIGCAIEDSSH